MSRLLSFILHKKGGSPEPQNPYRVASYIQSDGLQYIDTGITPKGTTKIEVQFMEPGLFGSYPKVFGSEIGHGNQSFKQDMRSNNRMYFDYISTETNIYAPVGDTLYTLIFEKGKITLNNIETTFTATGDVSNNYNIYLFAGNRSGEAIEHGALKLFYCKIYEGDTLVRYFTPCYSINDNEFGLYDNVTNTFFENKGTGSFSGTF